MGECWAVVVKRFELPLGEEKCCPCVGVLRTHLAPGDVGDGVPFGLTGDEEIAAHLLQVLCPGGHSEGRGVLDRAGVSFKGWGRKNGFTQASGFFGHRINCLVMWT